MFHLSRRIDGGATETLLRLLSLLTFRGVKWQSIIPPGGLLLLAGLKMMDDQRALNISLFRSHMGAVNVSLCVYIYV